MKWMITRLSTDEPIETYSGTIFQVMNYVNKNYEDGVVDVELYQNWLYRQERKDV